MIDTNMMNSNFEPNCEIPCFIPSSDARISKEYGCICDWYICVIVNLALNFHIWSVIWLLRLLLALIVLIKVHRPYIFELLILIWVPCEENNANQYGDAQWENNATSSTKAEEECFGFLMMVMMVVAWSVRDLLFIVWIYICSIVSFVSSLIWHLILNRSSLIDRYLLLFKSFKMGFWGFGDIKKQKIRCLQ